MDQRFIRRALSGIFRARAPRVLGEYGPTAPEPVWPFPDAPVSFAELVAASALLDFGTVANERWPGLARVRRNYEGEHNGR